MSEKKKQKLELTWIGKEEELKLEPRILVEDPDKSYGDPKTENMLIRGDNLLALKALEQDFTGKIKCIYIDPPYNTGSAFDQYDDNLEHSIWLSLMKPRLELLKNLLSDEGVIFAQIDDNEQAYLKVLMDEIFGRDCFLNCIAVKMSTAAGLKMSHKNKKLIKIKEYILVYIKNKEKFELSSLDELYSEKPIYETERSDKYIVNFDEDYNKWNLISLHQAFKQFAEEGEEKKDFVNKNYFRIFNHVVNASTKKIWEQLTDEEKIKYKDKVRKYESEKSDYDYAFNDHVLIPYNPKILEGDMWNDNYSIGGTKTQEGGVEFNNGKKREILIKRIINISTKIGDFVLDSFLGSGTTAAVAQKLGRKYIGIEMGEHAYTHCKVRLDNVISGRDSSGISGEVGWKGGGGYKFYELAPSLLKKDRFGNWIIEEKYNAHMLAAAIAKQEGFHFQPDESLFWKQAKSTEKDFLFVTTQFITVEMLDKIHDEMKLEESLLIVCKAYYEDCVEKYPNISIKKIPQVLLGRCQFGKDDYSLNIINLPDGEILDDFEEEKAVEIKTKEKVKKLKKTSKSNQKKLL